MKKIIVVSLLVFVSSFGYCNDVLNQPLMKTIAYLESSYRNGVVGDKHLPHPAYGMYQIRKPYLDDVLRNYRGECIAKFGKSLTLKDVQYCPVKSEWVVKKYLTHYGKLYTKQTGKPLTHKVALMLHNGGPNAWKSGLSVNSYAKKYAEKGHKVYLGLIKKS